MLLIQKKRFQFNKSYVYGSAAFVVGFAAVMAVLVHNAPIRVSNAETGISTETAKKETTAEETKSTQTNDAPAAIAMPTNNATRPTSTGNSSNQAPATPSTPAATTPEAPSTPVIIPPVTEVPEVPPVVDPPIVIDLPVLPPVVIPDPIIEVNTLGLEVKL